MDGWIEETKWREYWPPPGDGWSRHRAGIWRRCVTWAPERVSPYADLSDEQLAELARRAIASVVATANRKRVVLSIVADVGYPPPVRFDRKAKNSYYAAFDRSNIAAAEEWARTALKAGYRVTCNGRNVM